MLLHLLPRPPVAAASAGLPAAAASVALPAALVDPLAAAPPAATDLPVAAAVMGHLPAADLRAAVASAGLLQVEAVAASEGLPAVAVMGHPLAVLAGLPADLPVDSAGLLAGLPRVDSAGLLQVASAGLPAVAVMGRLPAVRAFQRSAEGTGRPLARWVAPRRRAAPVLVS